MNYYPFHVGDYTTHTAHLDPIEDLAYRRMLDMYYLREEPLPASVSDVARLIRLRDHEPQVESVLSEFFHLSPDGWRQGRCDAEIRKMQDLQQKQREKANKRWRTTGNADEVQKESRSNATAMPEQCHGNAGAMPPIPTPTPTPTPREKDKEHSPVEPAGVSSSGNPKPGELFPDVPKDILRDYMAIRKTRRSPLTKTAADILKNEARKAGISNADMLRTCCENSWLGFKASWMNGDKPRRTEDVPPARTFREVSL